MQIHTQKLLDSFPVRKSRRQKAAFRDWLTGILTNVGYSPVVETDSVLSRNVIVGDPEQAQVIFTAHYDTPAHLPLPNINFPRNSLFTVLAQLPLFVLLFLPPILIEGVVIYITDSPVWGLLVLYVLLIAVIYLVYAGPANPHNVNDNTSGIATLLEIALTLPEENRSKVAFIFFDNEEKGLVGSRQFKRRQKGNLDHTLLINFDCVSYGNHICFFPSKSAAKNSELIALLQAAYLSSDCKEVQISKGKYPSDQKHFPLGVGVAALRRCPFGLYLGRIHTARDTIFEEENIELLRRGSLALVTSLPPR